VRTLLDLETVLRDVLPTFADTAIPDIQLSAQAVLDETGGSQLPSVPGSSLHSDLPLPAGHRLVAVVSLQEVGELDQDPLLPREGWLCFTAGEDNDDGAAGSVIYLPPTATLTVHGGTGVRWSPTAHLPSHEAYLELFQWDDVEEEWHQLQDRLYDALKPRLEPLGDIRLYGTPDAAHDDPRGTAARAQAAAQGLPDGEARGDWLLLLQLAIPGEYAGFYYCIERESLRQGRWDEVYCEYQSH
jgi:hypothetical protein